MMSDQTVVGVWRHRGEKQVHVQHVFVHTIIAVTKSDGGIGG